MEPETDEQDTLCEAHKSYMQRYIAYDLERQERVSDRFFKGKESAGRYLAPFRPFFSSYLSLGNN